MPKQQTSKCSPDDLNKSRAAAYIYWLEKGHDNTSANFLSLSEFPKNKRERDFSRAYVCKFFSRRPWLKEDLTNQDYDEWLKDESHIYIKVKD